MEWVTGLEPAILTLARSRDTNFATPTCLLLLLLCFVYDFELLSTLRVQNVLQSVAVMVVPLGGRADFESVFRNPTPTVLTRVRIVSVKMHFIHASDIGT